MFFFKSNLSFFFSISDQKWTKNWKFGWHIFKSPQIYKQFQNLNRINDKLSNLRQKYTRKLSSLVNIKIMQKSWEKNVFLKGGLFKTTFYFSWFWRGGLSIVIVPDCKGKIWTNQNFSEHQFDVLIGFSLDPRHWNCQKIVIYWKLDNSRHLSLLL